MWMLQRGHSGGGCVLASSLCKYDLWKGVAVVKNSGLFSLGVLKYVVCLCRGFDGCCVFCLYCEEWSCRC